MKCNSTLRHFFALTVALTGSLLASSQTTYISTGGGTSYNLAAGDSLYIQSGVYTGYIGQFDNGAKITVAAGASFQPSGINNPRGAVKVLGTFKMNGWFGSNGGFSVDNYGTTWFTQGISLNEGPQKWTNNFGGTLRFDQSVAVNATTIVNKGTFTAGGSVTVGNSSSFTNNNVLNVDGEFILNSSSLTNGGKFNTKGLTLNSGSSINNSCRLGINGPITNNSIIYNGGLLWSSVANNNSKITNGGTITNYDAGVVKGKDFVNNGTLSGTGYWYFTGTTENYGTVGQNGSGGNFMRFYDLTRTKNSQIFDTEYGNVYSSAKWNNMSAPDTTTTQTSCSSEAKGITLPVKWDFFTVDLNDNTPVLTWGSEQDPGTVFNIQRSYDAANFTTIATVNSKEGVTSYKFEDNQVNAAARSVYYRIRAVEVGGAVTISETRTLAFGTTKTGVSVQVAPNPFTSQLNISYQSTVREKISIRVVNMNGTVMAIKSVNVSVGYNSIAITEAASMNKGMYLIQLIGDNGVIASERVIKQ